MRPLREVIEERLREIDIYLDLLDAIQGQVQSGSPRLGDHGPTITADQQKILHSSVFLQLYNLVESTITRCIEALYAAACEGGRWFPADLSTALREEWVRSIARTHTDLNYDNRLRHAVKLVDQFVQAVPVSEIKFERPGGNWDDTLIEKAVRKLGLTLNIDQQVRSEVKRKIKNDKGPLALVRDLRNDLAHGSISFLECGQDVTVDELKVLKDRTQIYLSEVVKCFEAAITSHEYLAPEKRPQPA